MRYYKRVENGYISMIGQGTGDLEITKEEYDQLMVIFYSMPTPPNGYAYRLKEDLSWEAYELPTEDMASEEIAGDELMGII